MKNIYDLIKIYILNTLLDDDEPIYLIIDEVKDDIMQNDEFKKSFVKIDTIRETIIRCIDKLLIQKHIILINGCNGDELQYPTNLDIFNDKDRDELKYFTRITDKGKNYYSMNYSEIDY